MNNKVKFLRGTSNEYAVAEKDNDTIYFTTDDGKLYIGDKEVSGSNIIIDDTLSDTSTNPVQNKVVKQAIDNKADKTVATTSADGLMSAADKTKLDGVEEGANKTLIDTELSSTSKNPVQNKVINAALNNKADITAIPTSLPANDVYDWAKQPTKPTYTASEVGADASGSANTALTEAKAYTDTEIAGLINGAPTTLDTLGEIADAMKSNQTVVEALNTAIGTKANESDLIAHTGDKSNPHSVTKSQVGLGNVPNVATNDQTPSYTEATSLTKLSSGEKLSVAFGKISKAITDLISHIGDSVKHITSTERTNWNAAKSHADSAHAPSNAQANVIETVKVNGTALAPSSKAVDITVPSYNAMTGATSSDAGTSGLVPAPAVDDVEKFLCGDGTWKSPNSSGSGEGYPFPYYIQTGVASTSIYGTIAVTFPKAFKSTPLLFLTSKSHTNYGSRASYNSVTNTSFEVKTEWGETNTFSTEFMWLALGEPED